MSDPVALNKAYAKVSNGVIVEYPVFAQHILNRSEPLSWYTEVVYDAKPTIPPYHYAQEIPRIEADKVIVSYELKALDLSSLLKHINPSNLFTPGQPLVTIEDILPADLDRIKQLAILHIQNKLDAFAQVKGYDNLLSATSYKDSTVIQFSTEASIAIALRDQVWGSLYTYLDDITTGVKPIPGSIDEIEAELPALVWP